MKLLKYLLPILLVATLISCTKDDDDVFLPVNEVEDLTLIQEISNDTHTVEMYSISGNLSQGYNDITIRLKDKTTGDFVEDAMFMWNPMMHMTQMMHSCPKSDLVKVSGMETIYNGYIVFQMAENADEGWDLTFDYTIDGEDFTAVGDISVPATDRKVVSVFMGTDDVRYIIAYVEPQSPEVMVNDVTFGLYKMENMMSFPVVEDFKIMLDPRMPSMGNHTSPNNEDLVYNAASNMYDGKLSLTMTGYWKLNLMLENQDGEILKGEEVTEDNESSSLYLEIEF
ncbi:MAG: hypothetical protein GY823_11275 [Flavobacteriaceae bacterium]|nr:hypothetical protein [Flavobacteriaceae bacterium]